MYQKFEELLKKNGVTAYEVAKRTEIATSTLSNWKNGNYVPKLNKLQALADYFGVPITYFLEEKEPETAE